MTHRCAATGCQHEIRSGLLMCMDHWRMVPAAQRRAVLATLAGVRRRPTPEAVRAYRTAVEAAVQAVQDKQLRKRAAADARTKPLF